MKVTARNNAKWNYARAILDSYINKNLNTLEKIQADEVEFKNKIERKKQNNQIEQRKYTEDEFESLYVNGG